MTLGDLELEVGAPNAERLLASTGLSVGEMLQRLRGAVSPHMLARALSACLADGEAIASLARSLAAEGAVKAEILKLYEDALVLDAPVKKGGKRGGK